MTLYKLYRNRIQTAVGLALFSPLLAIALFMFRDPTKASVLAVSTMLIVPSLFCAFAAMLGFRIAIDSWGEYYGSPNMFHMTFRGYLQERRQWVRDGYRKPIEIRFGVPPRARPPA